MSLSSVGAGPELCHSTSPPTHCLDGSASDDFRSSPGTKGIPGSREVGYKCCDGSQAHAVTGMPFPSPRMTSPLAGSWSQTQHGMERPGPVCMGTCMAHGFPGHRWDCAPTQLCSTAGTPLGHCRDTVGTSLPCGPAAQPDLNKQHAVRIQPAWGTVPGTRRTPHSVQSFGQRELGTAQVAGLSKWPRTHRVALVQGQSPIAPPGWGRATPMAG